MRFLVYFLASLLVVFSGSGAVRAQSAPAWQGVTATDGLNSGKGVVDAAGNFYGMGVFNGAVTVGSTTLTSTANNTFLAKYAPGGQVLWVRQFASSATNIGWDVAVDAAGNAYATGIYQGPVALGNNVALPNASGQPLAFVVRFSAQGTPEWAQFSTPLYRSVGLETDAAGHVFVLGDYLTAMQLGGVSLSAGGSMPATYLARLSAATGTVEWLRNAFTSPGAGGLTGSRQLVVSAAGEPVVLTTFAYPAPAIPQGPTLVPSGTLNATDLAVIRYSAQGTYEWVQQVACPQSASVGGGALDAAGNLYVVGGMLGPATFSPSVTLPHTGGLDAFLAKYSPTGTLLWAQPGGGPGLDAWDDVTVDAAGNAYLAGSFEATAQYGATAITSAGGADALLASYSPQGQLRWTQPAGGPGRDLAFYLGFDAAGGLYAHGAVSPPATFGPFTLTSTLTPTRFLARLSTTLATRPRQLAATELFPSPAHDQLHLPALPAGTPVQVVDATGRVVRAVPVEAGRISVRGLAPGLYQLRATDAQGRPCAGRVLVR